MAYCRGFLWTVGLFIPILESIGQHQRSPWFGCACCPSNACRFIPSVPGYIYAVKDKEVYVNLFVANESTPKSPEESRIETVHLLSLNGDIRRGRDFLRNFRFCDENWIPVGCRKGRTERFENSVMPMAKLGYTVKVNGKPAESTLEKVILPFNANGKRGYRRYSFRYGTAGL